MSQEEHEVLAEIESEELLDADNSEFPWVLFAVEDVVYGINSIHVLSIEILGESTPMVNMPDYNRGIAAFRGDMIMLIDLRRLFGLKDNNAEIRELVAGMMSSQQAWYEKLCASLAAREPITVELDPHKCAFGRWYYNFKTTSNSLAMHLKTLETPHELLHYTAADIKKAVSEGNYEEADRLLSEKLSGLYSDTMRMINDTVAAYEDGNKEMLVVIDVDGIVKGLIVDEIVSVEFINRKLTIPNLKEKSQYISQLAKREKEDSTVLMLDEKLIVTL